MCGLKNSYLICSQIQVCVFNIYSIFASSFFILFVFATLRNDLRLFFGLTH